MVILISFNVNGIRAALSKGLDEFLRKSAADFILIQETKVNSSIDLGVLNYRSVWNFAESKGYSGTMILFKDTPINIQCGFGRECGINDEGRIITLEYPSYYVINAYFPNSQSKLKRWYYRLDWFDELHEYLSNLYRRKPVIIGGDFNLAYDHLDIYSESTESPKEPLGFAQEEKTELDNLLEMGFVDTFRLMNPGKRLYTWWSSKNENHKYNRGRRIDYFLVSRELTPKVSDSTIARRIGISDHAPIILKLRL